MLCVGQMVLQLVKMKLIATTRPIQPRTRGREHQFGVVERNDAFSIDRQRLTVPFEFPVIDRAARHPRADAAMRGEVGGRARRRILREIAGAARHRETQHRAERHRDHVLRNRVRQPDAGIEPLDDDVDHAALGDDVELHLRVAVQKFDKDRHRLASRACGRVDT